MGERTGIAWTDHTFNPWIGCTAVSSACDHCYAEALVGRWGGDFSTRRRTAAANWRQPLTWNRKAEAAAIRRRVFCASLADVFDNQVPAEWRADLWDLIRVTPWLDWQLLTKRPQNIAKMLPDDWADGRPNVWLGTTVENQAEADRRIPHLLTVPALQHFLSCEPLLGPLDLSAWLGVHHHPDNDLPNPLNAAAIGAIIHAARRHMGGGIDWIIAGGESGSAARPWSIQWARGLRDQCAASGVAFFWKQNGEWQPAGSQPSETPGRFAFGDYEHDPGKMILTNRYPRSFTSFGARSTMERVGKKTAGVLLDGRQHQDLPSR